MLPDTLGRELAHPDGDDVLVVGAVEDGDLAVLRAGRMDPPEVVMGELITRRRLERVDATALGIHAREHVADRAVLARRVESLKDEQERPACLGPQAVLEQAEVGDEVGQSVEACLFVAETQTVPGIALAELGGPARAHSQLGEELGGRHSPEATRCPSRPSRRGASRPRTPT
jgi:hypothetical protein